MKIIQKFVCEICNKECYHRVAAEICELMHEEDLVLGSYLTHLGQVASSVRVAAIHVLGCDWCKDNIKETKQEDQRALFLRARRVLSDLSG